MLKKHEFYPSAQQSVSIPLSMEDWSRRQVTKHLSLVPRYDSPRKADEKWNIKGGKFDSGGKFKFS